LLPLAATFRLTAMAAILSVVSLSLFSGAASALMFRAQTSTDTTSDRVVSPLTEVIGSFQETPLFGLGIGSNSNAASSIVDSSYYWLNNFVEGEPARVMQDLGIAGFGLIYFFKLLIAYLVLKWIAWSRSKLYIATYLALASFLVPHVILITINNPTAGLYFWALAGVALSMYRMERAERRIAAAELNQVLEAQVRERRQKKHQTTAPA
jgi:O-antigen ligase